MSQQVSPTIRNNIDDEKEEESPSMIGSAPKSFTIKPLTHYTKRAQLSLPPKNNVFISEKIQRIRTSHPMFAVTTNRV
jgi:hypothetical protein